MSKKRLINETFLLNFESDELKTIDIASRDQIYILYSAINSIKNIYDPYLLRNRDFLPYIADYFAVSFYRYFLYADDNTGFDLNSLINDTPYISNISGTKRSLKGVFDALGITTSIYEWFEYEKIKELNDRESSSIELDPYEFVVVPDMVNISQNIQEQIFDLVSIYKNARSRFILDLSFVLDDIKVNEFSSNVVTCETITLRNFNDRSISSASDTFMTGSYSSEEYNLKINNKLEK